MKISKGMIVTATNGNTYEVTAYRIPKKEVDAKVTAPDGTVAFKSLTLTTGELRELAGEPGAKPSKRKAATSEPEAATGELELGGKFRTLDDHPYTIESVGNDTVEFVSFIDGATHSHPADTFDELVRDGHIRYVPNF